MNRSSLGPALAIAAAVVLASPLASAQAPVQPPSPQKHSCTPPGEFPGRLATDRQRNTWTRNANGYLDCLKKFYKEQEALAQPYVNAAKVHIDAGNAAIQEHNDAVKKFTEQQDAALKD
jgi:hypothetical protein